jgi:hypothetical protein
MKHYAYRAWHTNLPLTPGGVWHFYDGRAGMERRIREIREDYTLRQIPTRAFEANALYLEVIRLAYNLVTAFQRTCLPAEWQGLTLSKLRHRLFWLPGELTRPQNRPTLRLINRHGSGAFTSPLISKCQLFTRLPPIPRAIQHAARLTPGAAGVTWIPMSPSYEL